MPRIGCNSPKTDRLIISCLLAIQEMLMINTTKYFASFPQEVYSWVDAVMQASANQLSLVTSNFSVDNFINASQGYISRRADFQFALMEADGRSIGVFPDGTKCSKVESTINNTSFNYTRSNHPLICHEMDTNNTEQILSVPSPNACAPLSIEANHNETVQNQRE